jgi:hypothetical protein
MSMEEILAMARGKKSAGSAPAAAPPAAAPAAEESPPAAEEPAAEEPAAEETAAPAAAGGDHKSLKDKITSVAEQVAYCRKTDAKA